MYEKEIKPYRDKIDELNNQILEILAERLETALTIGEIKKKYGKQVIDRSREKAILYHVKIKAAEKGLQPSSVERIFEEIIKLCVEAEEEQ
jgi:chorismate mutase